MINGKHLESEIVVTQPSRSPKAGRRGLGAFFWTSMAAGVLGAAGVVYMTRYPIAQQVPAANQPPKQVLSYGGPNDVYFNPKKFRAGDKVNICFDGVVWHQICKSELVYHVSCYKRAVGAPDGVVELGRTDFPVYAISVPREIGPVGRKCRAFVVPSDCQPGPLMHSAFARHECIGPDGRSQLSYTPVPDFSGDIEP